MNGGLCHLFPYPGLSLSEPLERSHAVPVADPESLLPFFQQSLARCDWSSIKVQLFNFHSAGSSAHGTSLVSSYDLPKLPGSSSSIIHCKSWNKGRYMALFTSCRYSHQCSVCSGVHWAISCPNQLAKECSDESKQPFSKQPFSKCLGVVLLG